MCIRDRNVTYIILLILLVIFLATVGVQLIIKASLFISGVSKPDSESDLNEKSYLLPPELFALPDATNSATLAISGRGTENTDVHIYVNEEKVDTIAPVSYTHLDVYKRQYVYYPYCLQSFHNLVQHDLTM